MINSQNPTQTWNSIKHTQHYEILSVPSSPKQENQIRIVCISDTHMKHHHLQIPDGDILVHTGDFSSLGRWDDIQRFATWFGGLPHKHKIVIAGNHDLTLDMPYYDTVVGRFHRGQREPAESILEYVSSQSSFIYLCDEGVHCEGLYIYGSPWQPYFYNWAFNLNRGSACLEKWREIPDQTDVLLTHGPPLGHGDLCASGVRAGCVDLLLEIQNRIRPKLHVFGHIHEGAGITTDGQTVFVNAASCDLSYKAKNPVLFWDLSVSVS